MKQNTQRLIVTVMFVAIAICGCSDQETSESLKEKYGLRPLGVEECDNYLNKLRMCLDVAPAKNRDQIVNIYTFVVSDMKNLASDQNPEAQKMVVEACTMGETANKAAMVAMGCEW
ncbi:MAG: hypothetical protein D6B25_13955 [Desulfobulbaceae bacterium]|nr:MAG: hypothetical protein D6B25_13955 [Desulfobulbaceae bacterium]